MKRLVDPLIFLARGRCHGGKQDSRNKGPRIPVREDFIIGIRYGFYSSSFVYIYKTLPVRVQGAR